MCMGDHVFFFLWEESSGVWSNWNSTYMDPRAQKRAEGLLCGDRKNEWCGITLDIGKSARSGS